MIILSASNLTKVYGVDVIIDKASFHVNSGDKVGIVGRNGAGKTTLLNMLTGELKADGGDIFISQNAKVGYLKQRDNFNPNKTIFEEIDGIFHQLHEMEEEIGRVTQKIEDGDTSRATIDRLDYLNTQFQDRGGYTYKSEIIGVLTSMAFSKEDMEKEISKLSGGERTRLALTALLLKKPDILLLDEPTNHLDIGTLKWLEQYLASYKGTVIIVSHDRYFLNQTVKKILEVENHKATMYLGNYSQYAEKKQQRREADLRAYNNQQKEIARQEEMVRWMKQRGTEHLVKRAQSREKRLDMIERLERPESLQGKIRVSFKQEFQSGNDVLLIKNLSKSFGHGPNSVKLFDNVDMDIKRGERIAIVGANGIGKTTLLKMILEGEEGPKGYIKAGHNVTFGYYDQGQLLLNGDNTVLDEIHDAYRLYTDTELRSILGRFLFKGEDVFLKVASLSGGEKARLSLLKLMMSGANTLILDEPTNHLDIESKEVFEDALLDFKGTVIVVSHDRFFLQKIPTRILELERNGITQYLGKYDYYMEKKAEIESGKKYLNSLGANSKTNDEFGGADTSTSEENLDANARRILKKQQEAALKRREKKIADLEKKIKELEEEASGLEKRLSCEDVMKDYELLKEVSERHAFVQNELEKAYEEWAEISETGELQ